jgi:hypothetical protein
MAHEILNDKGYQKRGGKDRGWSTHGRHGNRKAEN